MNPKRSKAVLEALVQGIDPETGELLEDSAVLQRAVILRAMLDGCVALEGLIARETRRRQLPANVGKEWTDDEEQKLVAAFKDGTSLADIGAAHGRTVRSVEMRLVRLGLLQSSDVKTGPFNAG